MRALKVIAALLCYPTAELAAAFPELRALVAGEGRLPRAARDGLRRLIDDLAAEELIAAQERYVGLFDRVRSLSLHLFEHVHGESRDRGPAMVDLLSLYRQHGLRADSRELPDFLPMFLEFLSSRPWSEAQPMLADVAHILDALHGRLVGRVSPYAGAFSALLALAGRTPSQAEPVVEETLEELDRRWEEAPVAFGGGADGQAGCDVAASIVARFAPERAGGKT